MGKIDSSVKESELNIYDDLEAIRERPNLMTGTNDLDGVVSAAFEIIYNAIDEAMVGRCSLIDIRVKSDGTIRVIDDGCGVPMRNYNSDKNKYDWETVFCTLYGSGKSNGKLYSRSSGLNGVGATVCNYTSDFMNVLSITDGVASKIGFIDGVPTSDLIVEETDLPNGTMIEFRPSLKVFKGTDTIMIPANIYIDLLLKQSMLTKGLKVRLSHPDLNGGNEDSYVEFYYPNGVADFFEQSCEGLMLNETKEYNDKKTGTDRPEDEDYEVEMGISFNFSRETYLEQVYHNCSLMSEGGITVAALESGVTDAFTNYCVENGKFNPKEKFLWQDIQQEMLVVAWTACEGNRTYFKGQTKKAINNRFIGASLYDFVYDCLYGWLNNNRTVAERIVNDAMNNKKAREEADSVSKKVINTLRKGTRGLSNRIEELVDCEVHGEGSEIYFVEGKSARGSLVKARNFTNQAIFPLRGKTLNCIKKRSLASVLSSEIIVNVIRALGCGIECVDKNMEGLPEFDIDKLRYEKIMICTDADLDGNHIRTLMLSLIWRLVPSLLKEGRVFIVETPLFTVIKSNGDMEFAYTEQELNDLKDKLNCKYTVHRSKGLGEDDAEIMHLTAMNPESRRAIPVTFNEEDTEEINKLFESILGNDITGRKEMIDTYMEETASEGRISM